MSTDDPDKAAIAARELLESTIRGEQFPVPEWSCRVPFIDTLLSGLQHQLKYALEPQVKLGLACMHDPDWEFERAVMGDEWMLANKTIDEINKRALAAILKPSPVGGPFPPPK